MNASKAASALLEQLHAPRGTVTVMPRLDSEGTLLEVLLDDKAIGYRDHIPSEFEGFRIRVKKREQFSAYLH